MYFGVDYYPEHWNISMIDSDIQRIVEMGCNIVRIGEFAWHLMEKEEGQFDFTFFDMVIEKCQKAGLKVIFGTPTATFPAWLAKKHPSILSKDENLQVRAFGGRRQYCYNSNIYLEYSNKIVTKLLENYRDNTFVISWQVDNEFGHEGSDNCYCEICQLKFQEFLKEKYQTINKLNEVYGTIFWGQTYNYFNEIPAPLKTITTHNPTLKLDWMRFKSDSLNQYANSQIQLVKKIRGSHQTVTTNLSGGFYTKLYDHDENTKNLDFVSYDNYPVWGGLKEPIPPGQIAMTLDFIRGLQEKNFWILEQLMGAQGHDVIGYLPRPNQGKMWAYQAFAHGCESMLWFRYRGMTKGAEQYCFGILDQDNKINRKYREVQSTIKDISKYKTLFRSNIKSDLAIIYDFDNIWSWKVQSQSLNFNFTTELMRLYSPFYEKNINIDVISHKKDFNKYKILVLPVTKIIDEILAKRLEKFAKNGGTIVFSYRAGIKNRDNNLYFEKTLPCLVKDLCGISIEEIESLQQGQDVEVVGVENYIGYRGKCEVWRDLITPNTAETLFKYNDKFYSDKACITKNSYSKGQVYYIGGGVDNMILNSIAHDILKEKQIEILEPPKGLEVYKRSCEEGDYLIITNHSSEKKLFNEMIFPPYESKIIKI